MSLRQRRASPSSDPPPELVDSSVLPSPCAPPAARSSSPGDCGGSRQVLATLDGSPASTPSMLSSPGGTEAAAVVAVADWMGEGKRDCLLCVLAAHIYVYIHTSMYASIHTNACCACWRRIPMYTYIRPCMHPYTQMLMHACMHTHLHTNFICPSMHSYDADREKARGQTHAHTYHRHRQTSRR